MTELLMAMSGCLVAMTELPMAKEFVLGRTVTQKWGREPRATATKRRQCPSEVVRRPTDRLGAANERRHGP